jgi:hypothetical protein
MARSFATIARASSNLPHLLIARGEKAVWAGKAWTVLNRQKQLCRRFVKLTFEEIGLADRL